MGTIMLRSATAHRRTLPVLRMEAGLLLLRVTGGGFRC
jgi:hypothetical protein